MRKNFISVIVSAGLLGGAVHVALETGAYAQSSTTGALRGAIKDKKSGEALIGATVVATSSVLQGEQVVITDESGLYFIDNLPPGTYTLTVFYNDAKFSRGDVVIAVGKQAVVNVPIDTSEGAGGETIVIQGTAPIVDQGSTKTGSTITKEYTDNIPVGRTFGAVLGAAAGQQGDLYGASFSGSTSLESTYIVEGINTTDTAFGGISSNLPNEFIQETEVITGGYNAEFGRSTGGVINVVTKQGSNEFHGTVFGYFTPGQLVAKSDPIIREGSSISTETNLNYNYDVGGEVGGPILKDKLWFHVGFNPSRVKRTTSRAISTFRDTDMDASPDIDPDTGFAFADATCRTPNNGADGALPDCQKIGLNLQTYFFTAKVNGALSQNHQFQISAWGNPTNQIDLFAPSSAPSRQTEQLKDGAYDASIKWTSKFLDGKTQIDAVGGFHRGYSREYPRETAELHGNDPLWFFFGYDRNLSDMAAFEAPERGGAGVPMSCNPVPTDTDGDGVADTDFNPCPLPDSTYGIGGLGFYEQRTNDRLSGIFSVTQRLKTGALGYHTFKGGFEYEQAGYDAKRGLTGGVQYRHRVNGNLRRRTYLKFDDAGTIDCGPMGVAKCSQVDLLPADTKNRNLGAYAQDSWQIKPNLTINAGIRWEQQTGYTAKFLQGTPSPSGEIIPDVAFELKNQWAPRIGVIYDPTQEGRSKLFAHYGRFYETMPMDINVRAFGGEMFYSETILAANCPDTAAGSGPIDPMSIDPTLLDQCPRQQVGQPGAPSILGGGIEYVAPGTKGQYLDEFIAGAEYEFMPNFKMGLNYINRRLPIVIEDMSADSANFYLIGNPGENYDDVAAQLHQEALGFGLDACNDADPANDPETCGRAFEDESRSFNLSRIKFFDKPKRNYQSIQITADQRFSKAALVHASYTYSREYGNYPGLFSTETGQNDPNLTSMYDLQDLMANRYGPMGLDRPHLFKVDGFYQFDLKTAGVVVLGTSFRAQSGLPVNTLGQHALYGPRESYILPRGIVDRTPTTWQADMHASYGYKLGKNMKLEGFVDVFNLFNNQETVSVDEQYTTDPVNPVVGGDLDDLAHAKAIDPDTTIQSGRVVTPFKNFDNETAHQAPRSFRFGLRLTF